MQSAELFCGCGGLALGMSRAGFEHVLMVEYDGDAIATVQHNKSLGVEHVKDWPIEKKDVREVNWAAYKKRLVLLSGGPPCQPFGIGGKKQGHKDARDMWPEAIRAVSDAEPDAFLFENVRNLAGPKFRGYLEWIVHHLRHPGDIRRNRETHAAHLIRLQLSAKPPDYEVIWQVVNAADFGAPQVRYRVLVMGLAASLEMAPAPLRPTHSRERLLWDQYVSGAYWERHRLKMPREPEDRQDRALVARLRGLKSSPPGQSWATVRDAIVGLGTPNGRNNHVFQDGARAYKGHTGSSLDLPAKALKAGDHGVPGGENMIRYGNGSVRYFTLREAARLVSLPDDFQFTQSWTESMRQLGNAVPVCLAEAAAKHMRAQIETARHRQAAKAAA